MIINKLDLNRVPDTIVKNRAVLHIIFWILFTIFYSFVYGSAFENFELKFYHTLLLLPVMISASYFTMLVLIERLLFRNKIILFLFTFIISTFFFTFLQVLMYYFIILPNLYPKADINKLVCFGAFLVELLRLYAIVALTSVLKILRHWYGMKTINDQLIEKNLKAELNLLKGQIHPHFLFNTLNNLYSLALAKHDKTADGILKLSSLLNFMLYEANSENISLKKEVGLIKNYIQLEKLRYDDKLILSFDLKGKIDEVKIAPLILLPFIENAFKHGVSQKKENNWIVILLEINEKDLHFEIENTKPQILKNENATYKKGIGLKNVKRRLELLYNKNHILEIENKKETYKVSLNLTL